MDQAQIYLLGETSFAQQADFCCRLCEKAFHQGHKIHIQTQEPMQNEALNEALWSFRADSYLPHTVGQNQADVAPITIDTTALSAEDKGHRELLILLCPELPLNANDFQRLALIVPNDEIRLAGARKVYKQLQQMQVPVTTHDLRK